MLSIDGANGLQGMMEINMQRGMDALNGMHGVIQDCMSESVGQHGGQQGLGGVGHQAMPPSQGIMNQIQMQWGNGCGGMQGNANHTANFGIGLLHFPLFRMR